MNAHHIRHRIKRLTPKHLLAARAHRRTITKFAEKMGLVYFGSTQRDDEDYRLVRGLTLSPHVLDAHYCIGTYDSYDVVFVERSATYKAHQATAEAQHWLIMAFDLKTKADLPHIFVGRREHSASFYAQFFTKFPNMSPMGLTTIDGFSSEFLDMYTVYCRITAVSEVLYLFDPTLTKVIGERFNGLTIEIADGTLYIYGENATPTSHILDTMLRYGAWLAETIDVKTAPVPVSPPGRAT